MSRRTRMMVRQRVSELRLPAPERAAARAERRVEAAIRRERDNYHTPERRAAALQAELRRFPGSEWTDW